MARASIARTAKQSCLSEVDLIGIMATSRDYDALLDAWTGWRTVSPPMRDDYTRFVELINEGAKELGFADAGALWRSGYDMSAEEFEQEAERLWKQVKPLYEELHCYVRDKLAEQYGDDKVPAGRTDSGAPAWQHVVAALGQHL